MSSSNLFLSFTILASSFWGSWHCVAMCSPVASLMAHKNSLRGYQLGRGFGYTLMGSASGWIGSLFLAHEIYNIRLYTGVLFALILFLMGLQAIRQKKWTIPHGSWINRFYRPQTPGLVLGLLSVFLPCGWLYTYIFAAMATQSAYSGALVMSLFWLGGLPALSSISLFMKRSIQVAPGKKQRVAGFVLIFASLYSIASFYFMHH